MISINKAAEIVKENNIETEEECLEFVENNWQYLGVDSFYDARYVAGLLKFVINADKTVDELVEQKRNFDKKIIGEEEA